MSNLAPESKSPYNFRRQKLYGIFEGESSKNQTTYPYY